ncbi:hypothetical protein B23_3672 [Geobacillus thermoleovorans B23]|nr:hypothetical protein B23_3672 [Geobacillus thermoleovorans B23]
MTLLSGALLFFRRPVKKGCRTPISGISPKNES